MFGYKAENKFARSLWYVFATSAAIVVLIAAGMLVAGVVNTLKERRDIARYERQQNDPAYLHEYRNRYVGPNIVFHDGAGGYLYDVRQKRRTATGIAWICRSEDGDSLAFFSDGEKRGYFNRFTGKVVVPPQYDKAWVFSEGVACVMKQGQIQFIDHSGRTLLNRSFVYTPRVDEYCFHNGLCIMMGDNERIGLVDRQGQWVVNPDYKEIDYKEQGFWMVYDSVWNKGLLYADGRVFLSCEYDDLRVDDYIYVRTQGHLDQVYDFEGRLVNACNFREIETMEYESDESLYSDVYEAYVRKPVRTNLRKYRSSDDYYGLMDKDGNIITPPSYICITAIGPGRYHCDGPEGAVILDDKGRECGKKL